jgi:type VI secretion system FHA domain protein
MTLVLTTLRCPDGVRPETREIEQGEISIGRSQESDWTLPDPGRVLSKRHCLVTRRGDAWELTDTSSNGTSLKHEPAPLGRNATRVLRDGDRLILGPYEIEVALRDRVSDVPLDGTMGGTTGLSDPSLFSIAVALPPDMDDSSIPGASPQPVADRAPVEAQHFRPPSVRFDLLPEDWDADLAPPMPPTRPDPIERPGAAAPEQPSPIPDPAPPRQPHPTGADGEAFAAFLDGAGVSAAAPEDVPAALRELGRAFRAMVIGLRRMVITRAAIKSEFRIDRTMIRPVGNNPLKFSADDDDALRALLGRARPGDMPAERAVGEAMRDMRLHELAVTTAMQQAARDLLAALAPEPPAHDLRPGSLDKFPGAATRRKARLWDAYAVLHARTVRALDDDFDSVFGKSFVRAYERVMAELRVQESDAPSDMRGGEP